MSGFDVGRLVAAWRRRAAPLGAFERGVIAREAGDRAAAMRAFETALAESADDRARARAHNKRGVLLVESNCREEALDDFCRALALDERCAPALVNVGNLLLEDGHALDAIDYYDAAVTADESYPLGYRNLGIALRRVGRRAESVRALRSADRLAARRDPRA